MSRAQGRSAIYDHKGAAHPVTNAVDIADRRIQELLDELNKYVEWAKEVDHYEDVNSHEIRAVFRRAEI